MWKILNQHLSLRILNSLKRKQDHVWLLENYLSLEQNLPFDPIARFAGIMPLSPNKPTRYNNENRWNFDST